MASGIATWTASGGFSRRKTSDSAIAKSGRRVDEQHRGGHGGVRQARDPGGEVERQRDAGGQQQQTWASRQLRPGLASVGPGERREEQRSDRHSVEGNGERRRGREANQDGADRDEQHSEHQRRVGGHRAGARLTAVESHRPVSAVRAERGAGARERLVEERRPARRRPGRGCRGRRRGRRGAGQPL